MAEQQKVTLDGDLLTFNDNSTHIGQFSLVNKAIDFLLKENAELRERIEADRQTSEDEMNYYNRDERDQASRSGLSFTHGAFGNHNPPKDKP